MDGKDILIIGAGLAGLSTAWHLNLPCELYEKEKSPGGICRSENIAGCTFDYAPRILLPGDAYTDHISEKLLGENLSFLPFSDWIYHHEHKLHTRVPLQKHLYGLPAKKILSCLKGMAEAPRISGKKECGANGNYQEWLHASLGRVIADKVIIPQERKKWKTDPVDMDFSWAKGRVPRPDLETSLLGALYDIPQEESFGYPPRMGISALMGAFLDSRDICLGTTLVSVNAGRHEALFKGGIKKKYRAMVSTLPLPLLVEMIDEAPLDIKNTAREMEHVSLSCVCMVVKKGKLSDKQFVYVYDPDILFHRVSFLSNLSPFMAPPGRSSLVAEVSYMGAPPYDNGSRLIEKVRDGLVKMDILHSENDVEEVRVINLPYAYPLPKVGWKDKRDRIRDYLNGLDIYPFGRFGEWEYLNMNHIIPRSRDMALLLEKRYG